MRVFIAIEIPEDIKEELAHLIESLKDKISNVKWVERENFHITLRFIGEVSEDRIPVLERIIDEVSLKFSPFEIELKGTGKFPHVIWVGIDKGSDILKNISYSIEGALIRANFSPTDKPFSPHITLGRVKKEIKRFQVEDFGPLVFLVDSITLMQSQLFPSGPIYTPINTFLLRKEG